MKKILLIILFIGLFVAESRAQLAADSLMIKNLVAKKFVPYVGLTGMVSNTNIYYDPVNSRTGFGVEAPARTVEIGGNGLKVSGKVIDIINSQLTHTDNDGAYYSFDNLGNTDVLFRADNSSYTVGGFGVGASTTPTSTFQVFGSIGYKVHADTNGYAITATDHIMLLDPSVGGSDIYLPSAATREGRNFIFIKSDATADAITLYPDGTESINFTTDYTLTAQGKYVSIVAISGNWYVISNN